ncbi:hypothetical protein SBF1_1360003 [Candidatus Desulfosporosinus infrequens]|uniref:Uncharacterized protein n=1 Tax=Candidatus Desulfosporosinus infrequens TaxID=2043169 RepID=A0A2U3K4L0_9FIRM|nr:hypothetical protein SBF1_1360003 [Candidatus Desulfosporosinus infrequens]
MSCLPPVRNPELRTFSIFTKNKYMALVMFLEVMLPIYDLHLRIFLAVGLGR